MEDLLLVLLMAVGFFNGIASIALGIACSRMARRLKRLEGK